MKEFYNKLVRDNIPDIIRDNGCYSYERCLTEKEFENAINDKIIEEAKEVINAKDKDGITKELADLLEVLILKAKLSDISFYDVEDARIEKKQKNGGFDKMMYLIYAADEKYFEENKSCIMCEKCDCELRKKDNSMYMDAAINCEGYVPVFKRKK